MVDSTYLVPFSLLRIIVARWRFYGGKGNDDLTPSHSSQSGVPETTKRALIRLHFYAYPTPPLELYPYMQ